MIWSYSGVAPEEMEKRFVTVTERAMTTTVNDIEHIESQCYNGVSVIKVFFHEGAKVEAGVRAGHLDLPDAFPHHAAGDDAAAHHSISARPTFPFSISD